MFQFSAKRLKALLTLTDDLLGDPPTFASHPHRRSVRIARDRRPGSVSPRAMHCLCPVRRGSGEVSPDRVR